MPNPKEYYIKGKLYQGVELTEGEQLILLKENNKRLREYKERQNAKDAETTDGSGSRAEMV